MEGEEEEWWVSKIFYFSSIRSFKVEMVFDTILKKYFCDRNVGTTRDKMICFIARERERTIRFGRKGRGNEILGTRLPTHSRNSSRISADDSVQFDDTNCYR